MENALFWVAPIGSIIALIFAWIFFKSMMKADEGNEKMVEIANHVKDGAMAYLKRQYKVVTIVFIIILVILTILAFLGVQNPFVPFAFLTGGFFSGLCGFLGMKTATHASSRTAQGGIEDGRVYFRNPWGPYPKNIRDGHQFQSPPYRVEKASTGYCSMKLSDFAERVQWSLITIPEEQLEQEIRTYALKPALPNRMANLPHNPLR